MSDITRRKEIIDEALGYALEDLRDKLILEMLKYDPEEALTRKECDDRISKLIYEE